MSKDLDRTGGPFREAPLVQPSASPSPRIVLREDGDELLIEAKSPLRRAVTWAQVLTAVAWAVFWIFKISADEVLLPVMAAGIGIAHALVTLRAATTETRFRIRDDVLTVEQTGLLRDASFSVGVAEIGKPAIASHIDEGRRIHFLRIPAASNPDEEIHLFAGHPVEHLTWLAEQISAWLHRRGTNQAVPTLDPEEDS